ncbi:vacuolar protein sorting-associated protein 9A-like isoform X1 [Rhododendron vialii]|uniref:vacuolar protein sorting-associated protein 9A-like isoform X1 n=1 Tax=Rhododendron vialii TaxID=182163 RepID=UPI00265F45DD|nr:vacuolar protein sorting-associated protein 9A-like isoform X1 [Rhododendron vialii]
MENADVFGSSTAPLTWHDFLERMRQPSAADFVKAIKSFIVSFSNNPPDPERDSAAVQEFLCNMEAAFRAHSLWAGCSEEELESAGEGLEKYVMTKLFPRVFASVPDDVKVDDELHEKMALIQQFIHPENLDIQPIFQNETSWLLAQKELQKINMYKAPRDKLVCILNCCKVINNLLLNASIAENQNPPGADEFLPVLIFVTIKANPPQLHSNLLYIQRYRRQSRLVAETAYFFTNILSAESFILNIDANALSMGEAEFQNNMESARVLLSGLSAESDDTSSQSDKNLIARAEPTEPKQQAFTTNKHQDPRVQSHFSVGSSEAKLGNKEKASGKDQQTISNVLSTSDLENIGASMLMMEDQVSQIFQDFPYLFSQAGDLTVSNVEELLDNYKQLVFRYVCLSKGMGISIPSPPLSNSHHQSELIAKNANESEDTRAEESNYETEKDTDRTDDDSNGVSLPVVEKSESKIVQDEALESQSVVND